jgi:putative transposase
VTKAKKIMGVQQVLLSPNKEVKALLEYLCQQSGKLYNSGVYLARQTFFKTGQLLTGKFDLSFEPSVSKSTVAKSLPSTPMQQTLMSVTEAFKSFKELRDLYIKRQLHFFLMETPYPNMVKSYLGGKHQESGLNVACIGQPRERW